MSPLSKKGAKILDAMTKEYGDEKKAKSVMYGSISEGRITGADPTFEKRMKARKSKKG
jgi:hypothetical protein